MIVVFVSKRVKALDLVEKCARTALFALGVTICLITIGDGLSAQIPSTLKRASELAPVGREVSVAVHLRDGQEFSLPVGVLLGHGELLFKANWTEEEGGGRPLSEGTGRQLADGKGPLTGERSFNRVSAPDANSCAGCHNAPYGILGGGGDFVTNVFVLGRRFDFMTFDPADKLPTRGTVDEMGQPVLLQGSGNLRATTGLFGAGYLEMLARQITEDLQRTRGTIKLGEAKELVAKGIHFGRLSRNSDGLWDTTKVEGLGRLSLISSDSTHPPMLMLRSWQQAGDVVSLREFTNIT